MAAPIVVDLRNIYRPDEMERLGFYYESVGRASARRTNQRSPSNPIVMGASRVRQGSAKKPPANTPSRPVEM